MWIQTQTMRAQDISQQHHHHRHLLAVRVCPSGCSYGCGGDGGSSGAAEGIAASQRTSP